MVSISDVLAPKVPLILLLGYIHKKTFVYFELMILVLVVLIMKVNKLRQIKNIFQKISELSDRS